MKIEKVKYNETEYIRISDEGFNYTCGYYSQNRWVDDERLVLLRYRNLPQDKFYGCAELILLNLNDGTHKVLVQQENKMNITNVVYGNMLYYADDDLLCSINIDTLEKNVICRSAEPIDLPHMTSDGRYINWSFENAKNGQTCYRVDLETGEVIEMFKKSFLKPFDVANHMMICPTNPDLMFFSHEGDARYITNRLWLAPLGEECYNIAPQRLDENGNLIDCFGHESWGADGKGLYFVKYKCSPSRPNGIGYVDVKTRQSDILYTNYDYWHVSAAPNGKYLAADLDSTGTGVSGVCLIDVVNNTEKLLVRVRNNNKHPGHPHPQFNPSCNKICFNEVIDENTVTVGIINI